MSSYQLVEAKWYALIKNCLVSHVCLQQIETSDWIKARISAFTSKASEVFRSVCHCENRTYFSKMSDVLQNFADDVFNFDCDRELSNGNRIFHGQRKTVSVGDACKHGEVIVLIFNEKICQCSVSTYNFFTFAYFKTERAHTWVPLQYSAVEVYRRPEDAVCVCPRKSWNF